MMKRAIIISVIVGLLPACIFALESPLPKYKNIAPGVWYGEVKEKDPPIVYHVLKVDLSEAQIAIEPIRPGKDETLGQLAKRFDSEKRPLLGAISGDYYHCLKDYGLVIPWGILIKGGNLVFSPTGHSALCWGGDKGIYISIPTMKASFRDRPETPAVNITTVNRQFKPGESECGIYNSTWGTFAPEVSKGFVFSVIGDSEFQLDREIKGTVSGISRLPVRAPIPENGFVMIMEELPPPQELKLKLGSPVMVNIEVSESPESAIGGGPRILREGKVSIEMRREKFGSGQSFYIKNSRHPRSAVGLGPEAETLFLVVVEGRSDESQGMNLKELSLLLLSLGATEAMAFDGGRSVSMYSDGKEVVKGDRQIADVLGIFKIKP